MTEFVELAIPIPLRTTFSYAVPVHVRPHIRLGQRVLVPFANRKLIGYVLTCLDKPPDGIKLKSIIRIVDVDTPTFNQSMLAFVRWIAEYYLAPLGEVLKSAHPAGTNTKSIPALALGPNQEAAEFAAAVDLDLASLLVELREKRRPIALSEVPGAPSRSAINTWVESGFVERDSLEQKGRIAIKKTKTYKAVGPAPKEPRGRGGRVLRRDEIHGWLIGQGDVMRDEIERQFPKCRQHLRQLLNEGHLVEGYREVYRDPFMGRAVTPDQPPHLNPAQRKAVDLISQTTGYCGYLLYGVTGSGKTEVYLRVISRVLKAGLGALVLVPEIALTPQLVERFRARFGDHIAVLHSALTDGERYDQWRQIKRGELNIVIGARSAIFAPINNIGVIVVDEEHDPSYKQADGLRYHARDMALIRGNREQIPVILGSATPSLESIFNVQQNKLTRLNLPSRATGSRLPTVDLIDLSTARAPDDGDRFLSQPVRDALSDTLRKGEQSIVFLNRRGFSSFVQCTACGDVIECHRCAISMTWHKHRRLLSCHYCNAARPLPEQCPSCQKPELELLGRGTEKVEDRIMALFPNARVQRLDRDTSAGRGLQTIVGKMQTQKIDILVGTQMVTKGHDFPNVTLVCVLDADAGLNFPDFRAGERTIQLLTQVAGRAGRGHKTGRVLIQTWDPTQPSLATLKNHDYGQFCDEELRLRALVGYPPYEYALTIRVDARNAGHAERAIRVFEKEVSSQKQHLPGLSLRGPAPAALERIKGRTRWAFLLTAKTRQTLRKALSLMSIEDPKRPKDIRVIIDVDPQDML